MRILHFLDANAHTGGVATHVKAVVELLRTAGHEPIVAGLTYPGPSARLAWADEHFPLTYGLTQGLRQQSAMKRFLKRIQPDVIHIHSGFTTVSPVLLRDMNHNWPVVGTLHDVRPFCFHSTRRYAADNSLCQRRCGITCISSGCVRVRSPLGLAGRLRNVAINACALQQWQQMRQVIVPSVYMRDLALHHGFEPDYLSVIPHFTEAPPLPPPPASRQPSKLLYLGRLDEKKGPFHFLEALATIRHLSWQVAFVGEGPAAQALRYRAHELQIAERVSFHGSISTEERNEYLDAAAMLIFPSVIPESFGLSGIEAMARARPVISFGLGGTTEWLDHEYNGLIANNCDTQELAIQIQRLLENPRYAQWLGDNGHITVIKKFIAPCFLASITELYKNAAACTQAPLITET